MGPRRGAKVGAPGTGVRKSAAGSHREFVHAFILRDEKPQRIHLSTRVYTRFRVLGALLGRFAAPSPALLLTISRPAYQAKDPTVGLGYEIRLVAEGR
jgi:hypothetical protein